MQQNWKFQRGDIFFTHFGASTGSEQHGDRAAVILQNDVGNYHSPTLIVATMTSKAEKKVNQPTHCLLENAGLNMPSVVQAEQIFTIDKSRILKYLGHLAPEDMQRLDYALKNSLALIPLGSIRKLEPIIRSTAAYAPPEVVDGKPPVYPYTPIRSSFEDAGSVEEMMLYTELQSAVHAMIQRLEYSFTFNPSLLTIPKRKQQVSEILAEAEKYNVRVAVDYHKRWDPAAINVRNELQNEESGAPIRGYMCMDDIIDVPTEWFNWADKSSPVHFLGTHCYDQIRWYMGCEVEEVYAVGTKKVLKARGVDTYDSIQATLKMENGCYWTVENSWILPKGFAKNNDGRTQILCENAMFRIDSQNRGVEIYNNSKLRTPNSYFILNNCGRPSGFGIEPINDFIYCLQNDLPFIADGNDGLQAELIAEAVHESLEKGVAVKLKRD